MSQDNVAEALIQAWVDMQTTCGCEASKCRLHAPFAWSEPWLPVYYPSTVGPDSPRMIYVGKICNTCAEDVVNSGAPEYVTKPLGTWDGE
jgi:hypothetical protein